MKNGFKTLLCLLLSTLFISVSLMPAFAAETAAAPETTTDGFVTSENNISPVIREDGTPPVPPDGEIPPEAPDGAAPPPVPGEAPGFAGNDFAGIENYPAVKEFPESGELKEFNITSSGPDENGIRVSGGAVTISNVAVERTSFSSTGGDLSSFYGVGAAMLSTGGDSYIYSSAVQSNAPGGTGIFSYGDATVYAADTGIHTLNSCSGGIHAAGGGKLYAWNVSAETEGDSSAAIRSDRGGGTITVEAGEFTTGGAGSPAVYSTADISVNNAKLTAKNSEVICVEGKNSVNLYNCDLSSFMKEDEQNDCTWSVIVYQSMSGDAEQGCGAFRMRNGSLTSHNGGLFYTTNTDSEFYIENVNITCEDENDFFLRCTGNANSRGWGESGQNGANCKFTAVNQQIDGNILYDSISNLDFRLSGTCLFKGSVLDCEDCVSAPGNGKSAIYIDSGSVWTVTGDSVLSDLYNMGRIEDEAGSTVSIIGSDGTVIVEGESGYTVTVQNYYTFFDVSESSVSIPDWNTVKVEKPAQLEPAPIIDEPVITDKTGELLEKVKSFFFEFEYYIIACGGALILIIVIVLISTSKKRRKRKLRRKRRKARKDAQDPMNF